MPNNGMIWPPISRSTPSRHPSVVIPDHKCIQVVAYLTSNIPIRSPHRRGRQPNRLDKRRQIKAKCLTDLRPRHRQRRRCLVQQVDVAVRVGRFLSRWRRTRIGDWPGRCRSQGIYPVGVLLPCWLEPCDERVEVGTAAACRGVLEVGGPFREEVLVLELHSMVTWLILQAWNLHILIWIGTMARWLADYC